MARWLGHRHHLVGTLWHRHGYHKCLALVSYTSTWLRESVAQIDDQMEALRHSPRSPTRGARIASQLWYTHTRLALYK